MLNPEQQADALQRAFARIGLSGMFDVFVEAYLKENPSPKLTEEEIEFVKPFVEMEQKLRWIGYRISSIKKAGYDPGESPEFDDSWKTV